MKPYNLMSACAKCGVASAATQYMQQPSSWVGMSRPLMLRQCSNCSYQWTEEPLDNVDKRIPSEVFALVPKGDSNVTE